MFTHSCIKEKEINMFGLTIKNTESKATISIENSSIICSHRSDIAILAMQMGAIHSSNLEALFTSEKQMYNFVSKLAEFCNN